AIRRIAARSGRVRGGGRRVDRDLARGELAAGSTSRTRRSNDSATGRLGGPPNVGSQAARGCPKAAEGDAEQLQQLNKDGSSEISGKHDESDTLMKTRTRRGHDGHDRQNNVFDCYPGCARCVLLS